MCERAHEKDGNVFFHLNNLRQRRRRRFAHFALSSLISCVCLYLEMLNCLRRTQRVVCLLKGGVCTGSARNFSSQLGWFWKFRTNQIQRCHLC